MNNICQDSLYKQTSHTLPIICKVSLEMESIGDLIQRRLKELNLSKSKLAEIVGVSRAYIGDLANGTAKTQSGFYKPKPETVTKLANALKVSENEILEAIGYNLEERVEVPERILQAIAREGVLSKKDEVLIANFIEMLKDSKRED